MAFINNVKIPSGSTYDIQAKSLAPLSLNSTTLNNTSGTFAFRGEGQPWTGTDWVGFQIGDDRDKFQITYTGENLLWRQNDSGGTNNSWTAWKPLPTTTYSLNISTGSNSTIRLLNGATTVTSITVPNTTNTTYGNASTSAAGLMSADDKKKLNACSTVDHNTTYSFTVDSNHLLTIASS